MTRKLTMLGTGHALVTKCYNTCFTISEDEDYFLVDAGGGNGILAQMERADISFLNVKGMFLTHAHTDHILGAVWVVRIIATMMQKEQYTGDFTIYCHDEAAHILYTLCDLTLIQKQKKFLSDRLHIQVVENGEKVTIDELEFTFFDIGSTKTKQFGFQLRWSDGLRLVCLGDEPFGERSEQYAKEADWLLSEAYCLYGQKDIYKPYEKHHSTALDAGKLAENLRVQNLLLYHTEDNNLARRKELYTNEVRVNYTGNVFVPDDLEVINLDKQVL